MKASLKLHPLVMCGVLWLVLLGIVLATRPLLNTIETRAMTVAWEMHVRDSYLVPTLNFKPYTQKPPLLAWLINGVWAVAGVHAWAGTLIAALFGFASVVWTWLMARRLWPHDVARTTQIIWLCLGSAMLPLFGLLIFYDMMLTCFALGCVFMLYRAAETARRRYFFGLAALLALAGLTKGPVILLHIVPLAVLAPLWTPVSQTSWPRWYAKLTFSLLLGAGLALLWAIPAALQGGKDYAQWILLQQTTKRVVKAFNHQEPWYFYLKIGLCLVLPWVFLVPLWRNLGQLKRLKVDPVARFLMCWIVPVCVIFSIISGKQLHYLLPIWPALLLLVNHLYQNQRIMARHHVIVAFAPFIALAMAWPVLHVMVQQGHGSTVLRDIMAHSPLWPSCYMLAMLACLAYSWRKQILVAPVACAMLLTIALLHSAAAPHGFTRFTTQPITAALHHYADRPIATTTIRYQGDYNFMARLTTPVTILLPNHPTSVADFFAAHPDGVVLTKMRQTETATPYRVLAEQPYRAHYKLVLITP